MWPGERAPPPLPPPRRRIRFPAEILLIGSSRGLRPSRAHPGRRGRIPLRTTLSQIPLKSCGFPGAESARKRFFLRGASPHSEKISAFPPHMSLETIGSREGSHPLELSRGAGLMRALVSDDAERGALCSPTPPRGRGARGERPSRALPGDGLAESSRFQQSRLS